MIWKKNAKRINGFKVIASEKSSNGLSWDRTLFWDTISAARHRFFRGSLNWEKRKKIYFVPR